MARVRAPEIAADGTVWLGTDDPPSLAALRGGSVLLHFWTSCCVNCLNVVEELRGVQRRFAGELTVVGVHSPKFPHEHDPAVVAAAMDRHRVDHPVVLDPEHELWDAYAVRAWPTLVLVDPAGYITWQRSGEGHAVSLAAALETAAFRKGSDPFPTPATGNSCIPRESMRNTAGPVFRKGSDPVRWPGKVAVAADGRLAVADTGADRVIVCRPDGRIVAEAGGLYQPQGVRWDGDGHLLVCETGADAVWRVDLATGGRELVLEGVRTPWDVVRWKGHVVIAEAGRHRLVGVDAAGEAQVVAGTAAEGLRDGLADEAVLAQPSGLAVTPAGDLAFVDAESSSLRLLDATSGRVRTLVGDGLWTWGDEDGDTDRARLQHPLGVAAAPDGALYVADTYNGALRVWRGAHLWTVPVAGLSAPGGVDVLPDGRVVIADTENHRVVVVDPVPATATPVPLAAAEPVALARDTALPVVLDVDLDGDVLDPTGGAPVRVSASSNVQGLLHDGGPWTFDALPVRVDVPLGTGAGRVDVELTAATCDPTACRLRRVRRTFDVLAS